jgi:hypothetical protein
MEKKKTGQIEKRREEENISEEKRFQEPVATVPFDLPSSCSFASAMAESKPTNPTP